MTLKNIKLGTGIIIIILLLLWLLTGIYTVVSGEEAIILRFGKHVNTVYNAGLHWHLPMPIDEVIKVNVSNVRRIEFGYKTVAEGDSTSTAEYASQPKQSQMFTADETLVNVETAIQYQIYDSEAFTFNVDDQIDTLEKSAESAIKRVVANHDLNDVLTDNKFTIQQEIQLDLQEICDEYGLGTQILKVQLQDVNPPDEVDEAFKDVANAREDKNSYINQAETYRNEVIPKANGNAAEVLNKAEAYYEKRIAEARGDVAAFVAVLEQYELGKQVTRKRMYIETMEDILPNIDKYILDDGGNTLKFLPLNESGQIIKDKKEEDQ